MPFAPGIPSSPRILLPLTVKVRLRGGGVFGMEQAPITSTSKSWYVPSGKAAPPFGAVFAPHLAMISLPISGSPLEQGPASEVMVSGGVASASRASEEPPVPPPPTSAPPPPSGGPPSGPSAPAAPPESAPPPPEPAMAVELTPPSDLKPPADAVRSTAGILTRVLRAGTGPRRPVPGDTIDVHYTGWTAEGKLISSSVPTGAPARVVLSPTAKGWFLEVPKMTEGEQRR